MCVVLPSTSIKQLWPISNGTGHIANVDEVKLINFECPLLFRVIDLEFKITWDPDKLILVRQRDQLLIYHRGWIGLRSTPITWLESVSPVWTGGPVNEPNSRDGRPLTMLVTS